MVDVISCRYRMEGLWFIALSTATSRTCALACRMNTALSVLSIRHHHLLPLPFSHTLPFHATIHKQSFIILIPSSPYLFSPSNLGPQLYVSHYFDSLAWAEHRSVVVQQLTISSTSTLRESKLFPFTFWCFPGTYFHSFNNWINVLHTKSLLTQKISFFSFKDGLCNIIFHSCRHWLLFIGTGHWDGCTPSNYGRILLQLLMLLSHILQNWWLSCLSVGHVILLKAFMVLGLCYWNVT